MYLLALVFLFFAHILVVVFLVGSVGSAVVVTLSFIEDFQELLGD